MVWPSFAAHMTNVKRADLQRLLNHVEKVPTGVRPTIYHLYIYVQYMYVCIHLW